MSGVVPGLISASVADLGIGARVLLSAPGCPAHADIVQTGSVRNVAGDEHGRRIYVVELDGGGPTVSVLDWTIAALAALGDPAPCRISRTPGRA